MNLFGKLLTSLFVLTAGSVVAATAAAAADTSEYRSDIESMKDAPRGPFQRLRWFCADGSVLPPRPYACSELGGGVQHGEYSRPTRELRAAGYPVATLLADLSPSDILDRPGGADLLKAMILEQFLVDFDDGWIFRKARFYRGAIQHEDEQRGGQALLEALAADPDWLRDRFLVLREAVRVLAHDRVLISLSDLRGRAAALAEQDAGFRALRGKIHGRPDAGDAQRVRDYARTEGRADLADAYEDLAQLIERTYATNDIGTVIDALASHATHADLRRDFSQLARGPLAGPDEQLVVAAAGMLLIRERLSEEPVAAARIRLLDSSLELERLAFVLSRQLETEGKQARTRRALLQRLQLHADSLYGSGLITGPEHRELLLALAHIDDEPLTLERFRQELRHLGMAATWASRQLRFHFGAAIEHFADIEPRVEQYIPDRLRASPLLALDELLNTLVLDAQSAGAVRHELFGESIASGLRSLNPGLARGVLHIAGPDTPPSSFDAQGIYIVPETLPSLPPVAGILTRSEGNSLSHVQLLARNLGIPNIVVSDALLERMEPFVGKRIVMAASAGGVVRIASDSFEWDNVFRAGADRERAPLRIDLEKLDLDSTRLYTLAELRSEHSGRVVGPKAAKLGELMHRFPGQVAPGLVVPFGVYRQLLQQPVSRSDNTPMIRWIENRYASLDALRAESALEYQKALETTLAFIREWFAQVPLPPQLQDRLRAAMQAEFGPEGTYGVFVRSDTNVEDLPNFSGAGLNLTVPNVVGFDAAVAALRRVWASPFTERAFSWRQSLMDRPSQVYASVLLQRGVPAERSGVLVTKDIDTGRTGIVTIVVNEGVGGGVDGQLAETLKIDLASGVVRRFATATATERAILLKTGGVQLAPVARSESVLREDEIEALRSLAMIIPTRVAEFADDGASPPPAADVEFGFYNGRLWLFQLRPFVESGAANRNAYLNALDAGLRETAQQLVDLDGSVESAGL